MGFIEVSVERPCQYVMTGKFESPAPDWIHLSRVLIDYELIIMTEGVLYIALNEKQYTIHPGEFLFCLPGCAQSGFMASECAFYWLHFTQPEVAKAARTGSHAYSLHIPVSGSAHSLDKVIVMMRQLQDAVRSYHDPILNNYLTTAILCEFYNQCLNTAAEPYTRRQQLYNDITDYVHWYRNTNLKVIDIANHFGYNEKYLSHLFLSIKGMSLKQFILQEKMELAKFMLTDTNDTISIIAEKLGFSDSHNFMKVFKKIVGMTPTAYRNTYDKRLLYYI